MTVPKYKIKYKMATTALPTTERPAPLLVAVLRPEFMILYQSVSKRYGLIKAIDTGNVYICSRLRE